jgi:hypothetical protein
MEESGLHPSPENRRSIRLSATTHHLPHSETPTVNPVATPTSQAQTLACLRTCQRYYATSCLLPCHGTSNANWSQDICRQVKLLLVHVQSCCRQVGCRQSRTACRLGGTWDYKTLGGSVLHPWGGDGEESEGYNVLFLRNECQSRGSFALGGEIGALFFKLFGFLGRHRSVDPG